MTELIRYKFPQKAPDYLIGLVQGETREAMQIAYDRMRSMVDNQEFHASTTDVQWRFEDIVLPKDMRKDRMASFIWAALYNITFHPILSSLGVVMLPIAVVTSCISLTSWFMNLIAGA
jgi:hypothetical protein